MKRTSSFVTFMAVVSTLFLFACSGGDGGSSGGGGGTTSPAYTFNASGGQGGADGGSGGSGGDFDMRMSPGSMGPLEVLAAGTADAGFSTSSVTANLGDNPLVVTADTTLEVLNPEVADDEPEGGTPYLRANSTGLYIWETGGNWATQLDSSENALARVTGISVASGTTLTLELNYTTYAQIDLYNDIDNQGTITTVDYTATQRGSLRMSMASYIGSGSVDTSGSLDGQAGGFINVYPVGSFLNSGSFTSAGADSATTDAGNGGYVNIWADHKIENTGTITTSGGAATGSAGNGGNADYIFLGTMCALNNSGNLTASGGAGIDAGGHSDGIYFGVDYIGDLRNSGDLVTTGGSAIGGNAGFGGLVDFYAYGGDIINSGDITTSGGSTTETASSGGNGGSIHLYVSGGGPDGEIPAGDILFSGNVDTSGGDAVAGATGSGNGGSGGRFDIEAYYYAYSLGQRVALLGYAGPITTSGGDGNYGGTAGDVELGCSGHGGPKGVVASSYSYGLAGDETSGCNITNDVDFISRGGNVAAGATTTPADGGDGGYVAFATGYFHGMYDSEIDHVVNSGDVSFKTAYRSGMLDPEVHHVVNSGAIDTSGGASLASTTMSSGDAGDIWIWGYNGVTNSGALTAVGGSDADTNGGTDGYGNEGGSIGLYSQLGTVENSGALTSDGGDGEYRGADADVIALFGAAVVNSGTLAANGGDADATLAGSVGGDGDTVELFAPNGMSDVSNTGSATNAGGTGETAGGDGDYFVGGLLM